MGSYSVTNGRVGIGMSCFPASNLFLQNTVSRNALDGWGTKGGWVARAWISSVAAGMIISDVLFASFYAHGKGNLALYHAEGTAVHRPVVLEGGLGGKRRASECSAYD